MEVIAGVRFGERARRERVRAISEETLVVLDRDGYEGFRVEEVARRVGVAKGTIYLDFDSKQQLIQSALASAGERLVAEVSAAVEGIRDPGKRLLEAGQR